jgi:4-hydroxy-tetrahydrodipicolinate reductase
LTDQIKVVQVGIGPLGQKITQFISQRKGIAIVGAVDVSSDLIGKDLGELCGLNQMVRIQASIAECLQMTKPDAIILTTLSTLEEITPQIEEIVSYGLPVVSTCEELSYPWSTSLELSKKIDAFARENQVAVLGTGVNPGFLMDSLPTFLTSVCQNVDQITVYRIQNAVDRRVPFQKKIGAGLTLEAFENKQKTGSLRHVGLTESMQLIASRLGWNITKTEDIISPVIAEKEIVAGTVKIPAGYASGVQQIGRGYMNNDEKITLIFRASVGEPEPQDTIEIKGTPNIRSTIEGGLHGDVATCAITINALKQVIHAKPGLRTMVDIPMLSFFC